MDGFWGETGVVELAASHENDWMRIDFEAPLDNPVVALTPLTANGADAFVPVIRHVDDDGFDLRLAELDGDGIHVPERLAWVAVAEGSHRLEDGRRVEAGAVTAAGPGDRRVTIGLETGPAPSVFVQVQSETAGLSIARVGDITETGAALVLDAPEADRALRAATIGWIAVREAEAAYPVGSRPVTVPDPAEEDVLLAGVQSMRGTDPVALSVDDAGDSLTLALREDRTADPETVHLAERVALATLPMGRLGVAAPAMPGPDASPWSDPATWGGDVPGEGAIVTIGADRAVSIDTDIAVEGIVVEGRLTVADLPGIEIDAGWIEVRAGGSFLAGTEAAPHRNGFHLTLAGDPGEAPAHADAGSAFLLAAAGGTVALHGADAAKASWTRLDATVEAGGRVIRLAEATGWEVGDRIVIASTDFAMEETETATIAAVSPDGRRLTLAAPLAHRHHGEVETHGTDARTWTLDLRAEVGLLSRGIVISGDAESAADGFGGHVMVAPGGSLALSGVELVHMGQVGADRRHAIHWQDVGDATGQGLEGVSIHASHNRAVSIAGTDNLEIEGVIAHDVIGHAFILVDGSETGNRFEGNLGLLTQAAEPDRAVLPSEVAMVSTFWLSNPANDLLGNIAGGADHAGFWFALPPTAPRGLTPWDDPLGRFEGNAAHSNPFANLAFDGHCVDGIGFVESEYRPAEAPVILDFTSTRSGDRGIWIRATAMDFFDVKAADNARATFFSYNQVLYDSLIVGRSGNPGTPSTPEEIAQGRSLPAPYHGSYFRGHSIYDGPSGVVDTHFAGFGPLDAALQTNGAAQKSPEHVVSGLTFADVAPGAMVDFSPESWEGHMWSSGIRDLDGSLTGLAGAVVTPVLRGMDGTVSTFNAPPDAVLRDAWSAWVIPEAQIGLLRADAGAAPGTAERVLWSRPDGARVADTGTFGSYHQTSVMLNAPHAYRLEYPELPAWIDLSLRFAGQGDTVVVTLPGLGPGATVEGAEAVVDRAGLEAAPGNAWMHDGAGIVVRLVAALPEGDPRFIPTVAGAPGAFVAGVRVLPGDAAPVLADPELPAPPARPVAEGLFARAIPLGGRDLTAADAILFEPGTGAQVFVRDRDEGIVPLGRPGPDGRLALHGIDPEALDTADTLILRTEDAVPPGRIVLDPADLTPVPVHLPLVARPGETVGIVGAAITGAQRGTPVTLSGVADVVGGSARIEGGNLFLDVAPGFLGLASALVLMRTEDGRSVSARVSFVVER